MRFIIYETLSDRGVPCFIEPDQLADAMQSFRQRVEVYGLIRYRPDGVPVSIKVDEIVRFPAREGVPDFHEVHEVHGILRAASGSRQGEGVPGRSRSGQGRQGVHRHVSPHHRGSADAER